MNFYSPGWKGYSSKSWRTANAVFIFKPGKKRVQYHKIIFADKSGLVSDENPGNNYTQRVHSISMCRELKEGDIRYENNVGILLRRRRCF